jgi:type IV pilus assembly protein PilN
MRITLNLATRPFADLGPAIKRLRIAMGAMAGASILLGLGLYLLHHKAEEVRARAHSLDGRIASITQERQGYENLMHQPANAQLLTQVAALNQLFDKKTFSWTLAMEDLETVLPGGVQVGTLEPLVDEKTGSITLRLRVIGPRDRAVEMVKNLEHAKRFVLPRIASENAESNGGPNEKLEPVSATNRVNLDVLAQYTPATEEELKKAAKPEKAAAEREPAEKANALAVPTKHPAPATKPKAGVKTPAESAPAFPLRRPAAPYPTLRPGQGVPNQFQPPRASNVPMTGVSRPPQPRQPNRQPNQGGPQ